MPHARHLNCMNLKQEVTKGVFFTAIAKYAGIFVTLGVTAVLSRHLSPEQFGDVAFATVCLQFFTVFGDMGLGPAVIQKRDLSEDDLRGVFSLSIWAAVLLSLLYIGLSFALVRLDKDAGPQLLSVLLILTANLFFSTLNMIPNALILKQQRFGFAAARSLIVQVVAGAIAIAAALMGLGIYALTINPILSSVALFVINFSQHPIRPRFKPGKAAVDKVLSFSAYQFGFQLVNFWGCNLDKFLIKSLSSSELGYYDKSYRLMQMPLQNISFVITPVLHPVLSQIQDDKSHISYSYLKVVKLLAYIGFPLAAAVFFMSEDLILFLFGDQWKASVPCMRILSLTIAIQMISSSSGAIFQASGDTKRLFGCGLFSAFTCIAADVIGVFVFHTAEAVAAGLCIAFALNFIQCYYSLFLKCLKSGWGEFWKGLLMPVFLSVIISVCLFYVQPLISTEYHIINLILMTAIAGTIAFAFIELTGAYSIVDTIKEKLCRLKKH